MGAGLVKARKDPRSKVAPLVEQDRETSQEEEKASGHVWRDHGAVTSSSSKNDRAQGQAADQAKGAAVTRAVRSVDASERDAVENCAIQLRNATEALEPTNLPVEEEEGDSGVAGSFTGPSDWNNFCKDVEKGRIQATCIIDFAFSDGKKFRGNSLARPLTFSPALLPLEQATGAPRHWHSCSGVRGDLREFATACCSAASVLRRAKS